MWKHALELGRFKQEGNQSNSLHWHTFGMSKDKVLLCGGELPQVAAAHTGSALRQTKGLPEE
jgi:hypothetical protein